MSIMCEEGGISLSFTMELGDELENSFVMTRSVGSRMVTPDFDVISSRLEAYANESGS